MSVSRRAFIGIAATSGAVVLVPGAGEIHQAGDGRPPRNVFVDGKRIDKVFYADTGRGFVRAYHTPLRYDRATDSVPSYELRGEVRVEFIA